MNLTPTTNAEPLPHAGHRCPECDYDLTGAPGQRCPGCGWFIDESHLHALARERPTGLRVGIALVGAIIGLASIAGAAMLVGQPVAGRNAAKAFAMRDGMIVVGIVLAAAGHLATSIAILLTPRPWPMRRPELATLVTFAATVSIGLCVIGASSMVEVTTAQRYVRGVDVTGPMEFLLAAVLFSLPGMMLLALRVVSFAGSASDRAAAFAAGSTSVTTPPEQVPFTIEVFGDFSCGQVTTILRPVTRRKDARTEALIASTWETKLIESEKRGIELYDGKLARFLSARASGAMLTIEYGQTGYRDFLGTNAQTSVPVAALNPACLANPLGVSATVITRDGLLAFGRRSARVAVHAGMLHAFGGMVEIPAPAQASAHGPSQCRSVNVFDMIAKELREELGLDAGDLVDVVARGIVRDRASLQPEMIFDATTSLTRADLIARFGIASSRLEHDAIEWIPDDPEVVIPFLSKTTSMASVAQAALLLHGRHSWGCEWFEQCCLVLYGDVPNERSAEVSA